MKSRNGSTADERRARWDQMEQEAGLEPEDYGDGGDAEDDPFPEIVTAASLVADDLPRPVELIDGLLHKGEKLGH